MIDVHLILGFLGAGKTTLIRSVLKKKQFNNEHILLIVNDYGPENYDSQLLKKPGIEILEITNGCLCCANQNRFEAVLVACTKRKDIDRIIIEPSGLFFPDQVLDAFDREPIKSKMLLAPIVTVLDVDFLSKVKHAWPPAMLRLIEFGQMIILNKTVGTPAERVGEIIRKIETRGKHRIYSFDEGVAKFTSTETVLDDRQSVILEPEIEHNLRFEFRKEGLQFAERGELLNYLTKASGLVRAKGNVLLKERDVFVNYVNGNLDIQQAGKDSEIGLSCFVEPVTV